MSRWADVVAADPDFARRVRACFDAGKHKTIATLRQDGSPRISGIEMELSGGDLRLGMMPGSLKARDVLRDGRLALHSPTADPPEDDPGSWAGEAKIAGVGEEVTRGGGPEGGHHFRVDVTEVVLTRVGTPPDHLVIESWHPDRGYQQRRRT
jgi:hypothetical protein